MNLLDIELSFNELDNKLSWDKDSKIPLPKGVSSFHITTDRVDGTHRIATESGYNDAWIKVEINPVGNVVKIRPNPLKVAMDN